MEVNLPESATIEASRYAAHQLRSDAYNTFRTTYISYPLFGTITLCHSPAHNVAPIYPRKKRVETVSTSANSKN